MKNGNIVTHCQILFQIALQLDAIYDNEDETTVEKFLRESTINKNKIEITTDLNKKYASIIPKLGFKHQLCIFHTKKSLNKQLKKFKDNYHLSEEEYQECHQQLKIIKDLFDLNDYDQFKKRSTIFNLS